LPAIDSPPGLDACPRSPLPILLTWGALACRHFFVWVILATVPSFIVVLWLPLDREFGRKTTG
jgi:hypothetical protein